MSEQTEADTPACGGCGKRSMAGIAWAAGEPHIVPLWVCYDCNLVSVVSLEDIGRWWVDWSRGRIKATGEWVSIEELCTDSGHGQGGAG